MKKIIEYVDDEGRDAAILPFKGMAVKMINHGTGSGFIAFYNQGKVFETTKHMDTKDLISKYTVIKNALNAIN